MELAVYQPTLGKIQEEPDDAEEGIDFDESILLEYAILTEEDLKKALYGDCPDGEMGCTCVEVESDWCNFAAFHKKAGDTNKQVIEKSLNQRVQNECNDMNSASSSPRIIISDDSEHHILNVPNDYDYDSAYNSLNGNDSGMHNIDSNSISSKSFSGSINESINTSLNDSINGSLFNLDDMMNVSSNLPLEQQGIEFNTVTGRKVFIKAIRQKYMNIYYVVSQQRLCGDFIGNQSVATFVMILNSLEIRQSGLKGKYFETHSLEDEMTFIDMASVARDNKLSAEVSQVFKESSLSNFRKAVKLSCKSSNILLLCCYHINNLSGQFSFIGGYFKDKDMVLLLTPSKSKFLARWIPMVLMWRILLNEVTTTEHGKLKEHSAGGYMLLQRNETNPRIAVRISKNALLCLEPPAMSNTQDFEHLLTNWSHWLAQPATDVTDDVILQAINYVVNNLNSQKHTVQFGITNCRRVIDCKVDSLTDIISKTKVYNAVKNQIDSLSSDSLKKLEVFSEWIISMTYSSSLKNADKKMKMMNFKKIRKKQTSKSSSNKIIYKDNLMLAMCLIFWPYSAGQRGTNAASLDKAVYSDLTLFPWDTVLRVQEQARFVVTIMHSLIPVQ